MNSGRTSSVARERSAWDQLANSYPNRVFSVIIFPEKRDRIGRLTPSGLVLDLGCGPLPFLVKDLAKTPTRKVIACDFSASMIRALQATLVTEEAELLVAAGGALPLRSSSLAAVLAINSILPEERDEVDLIMAEVARVIQPGGCLLAVLPAFEMSLIAAQRWGIDIQIDYEQHREYDTTGWQCFFTEADIALLMKRHSFSSFTLQRLYFTSEEEIAMIRKIYGERIHTTVLATYPLFEHFLIASR